MEWTIGPTSPQVKYVSLFPNTSLYFPSREFTHRVKSVSMAKFTAQEVTALQEGGNEVTCLVSVFLFFPTFSCLLFIVWLWFYLTCSVLEKYFSRNGILNEMDTLTAGDLFLVIPFCKSQCLIPNGKYDMFLLVSVMLTNWEISSSMCMWNGDTQEKEVLIGHQGQRWCCLLTALKISPQ